MTDPLLLLSATEVLKKYRDGSLSPVEVAKACLQQIGSKNPLYNAFVVLKDEKSLLAEAQESESRWRAGTPSGSLDGLPITIKDETDVIGWPTTMGSLVHSPNPAMADSPCVTRLRQSGALFLGKTTLPEFGHKGVTDSKVSGVTRNPWNPTKTPGGSSGGAAVAAATRMGFLHLGSDGGGSIRIPASFSGIFGIKPSNGTVSEGIPGPFATIFSLGPMARTVEDAALMLDVITEPDPINWNAPPHQKCQSHAKLTDLPDQIKVAYVPSFNNIPVDPEVSDLVAKAARAMSTIATVEEINLDLPELVDVFNTHWMVIANWLKNKMPTSVHDKLDPYLLSFAERGSQISTTEYVNAEISRMMIGRKIKSLFIDYDLILMPTMAMTAFDVGLNVANNQSGMPWDDWTPFTFIGNLTKFPASSVPCGLSQAGLPIGVQLIGDYLQDEKVMQASHALEKLIGFEDFLTREHNQNAARKAVA